VINVRFSNTGANELKVDDVSIPPKVIVSSGEIVAGTIEVFTKGSRVPTLVASPTKLPATEIESNCVLLNPGDALVFQLLLDGQQGTVAAKLQAAGFDFVAKTFAEDDARIRRNTELFIKIGFWLLILASVLVFWSVRETVV
jgi:hypothetical protein